MAWPPQILVQPPASVLAGIVQWRRRGVSRVTIVVKQLFRIAADGVAHAVPPTASDVMTGDDRVPFKPRADVLLTLPEGVTATLEVLRGATPLLRKTLAAEECVRQSTAQSARGPAATTIDLPDALDPRQYQIAPEDQQLDSLVPGDRLVVEGGLRGRLLCPNVDVTVHLRSLHGGSTPIPLNIDSVQWDLPNARCAVIARGQASWDETVNAVVLAVSSPIVQTPFKPATPAPNAASKAAVEGSETVGWSVELLAIALAEAKRAVPFPSPSSSMPRPLIAPIPIGPHVDTGTVVDMATVVAEGQRIAREQMGASSPQKPPTTDAPIRAIGSPVETVALSAEMLAQARAQANAPVPFASSASSPSGARAVMAAIPTAPRVDSGTLTSEELEAQRLAHAPRAQHAPAPQLPQPPAPAYTPPPHRYIPQPAAPLPVAPPPRIETPAPPPAAVPVAPAPGGFVGRFLEVEPVALQADDDDDLPGP